MDRFLDRIVVNSDGCWIWQGGMAGNGYGEFMADRTRFRAHVWSYLTFVGSYDRSMLTLDHLCHNQDESCPGNRCIHRRCVNPDHLEPVTHAVNCKRGRQGQHLSAQTHCKRGHEYTPENTIVRPGGYRNCRSCKRRSETLRTRALRAKQGAKPRRKRVNYDDAA